MRAEVEVIQHMKVYGPVNMLLPCLCKIRMGELMDAGRWNGKPGIK